MRRSILRLLLVSSLLLAAGRLAAVTVRAGGGCHGGEGAVPTETAGTTVVRIDGCTFAPTIDRVPVGTVVTFLNTATAPHDVTGTPGRPDSWGSPILEPGESYRYAFAKPGIYAYSCSLHPGMAGTIVASAGVQPAAAAVPDDPAVATAADPGATDTTPAVAGAAGIGGLVGAVVSWLLLRRRSAAG